MLRHCLLCDCFGGCLNPFSSKKEERERPVDPNAINRCLERIRNHEENEINRSVRWLNISMEIFVLNWMFRNPKQIVLWSCLSVKLAHRYRLTVPVTQLYHRRQFQLWVLTPSIPKDLTALRHPTVPSVVASKSFQDEQ